MGMDINSYASKSKGSELEPHTLDIEPNGTTEVVIKVTHCGLCHSDVHMIDNDWGMSNFPIVPGHEVVGEIVELGSEITHLKKGQRVGVGWQRSACLQCDDCVNGNENLCDENESLIGTGFGGFADHLVVDGRFAFALPDGVESKHAGPLMCGGITVYSGLRHAGMSSGQRIGVIGIGGLGHMGVQFARQLGNEVVAFTTSSDKFEEADRYGAHEAVNVKEEGAFDGLKRKPLDIILSTVPVKFDLEPYLNLLASDGTLCFVGVPDEALDLPIFPLLMKRRRIMASPIGGRGIMRDMLRVSDTYGVAPVIEEFAMSEVNQAIGKVRDNSVRYRAVLKN
mgnify:CR=1 FL=1